MEGASVKNRARRSGVRTRRTHKTPTTREKEPRKRNLGTGNNLVLCLRDARRPLSNRDANLRFATFWTRFSSFVLRGFLSGFFGKRERWVDCLTGGR